MARGQIFVAINQASVEAEQLHVSFQAGGRDINEKLTPLFKDVATAKQYCDSVKSVRGNDETTACTTFLEAAKQLKSRMESLAKAFNHAENVWAAEQREQQNIMQAADLGVR